MHILFVKLKHASFNIYLYSHNTRIVYVNTKSTNIYISYILQQAKETLLDPAKRANYDKWRNSGINISYKNWLGMKEHVHQVRN